MDQTDSAPVHPSLPPRAWFRRGPRRFDAGEFALDVVLDGTVGFPVPRRRRPNQDIGTELPPRFLLEVGDADVRVLEDPDGAAVETWPRGDIAARVELLDEDELWLELQWPRSSRGGRIVGEPSPEVWELVNLLVEDTRVQRGAARESAAALRRLATEMLPDEIQVAHQEAISEAALMLEEGERPLVVAGAMRGMSEGIVLVTDLGLRWCSGRRKGPLAFPRDAIRGAVREEVSGVVELTIQTRIGKDVRLSCIEPRERGAELASALNPRADALDALLAEEEDGSARLLVSDELELVRGLLKDSERPTAYAGASRGVRVTRGALVVTEQRLLWAAKKGDPVVIERADIEAARVRRRLISTGLELRLADGHDESFETIEPRDRAASILAALGF